jgi:hypothetical protein
LERVWRDAYGNATFRNGKFILWVNDTSGGWGLAKICRGLMPHDWGLRYAPLDNEIIIDRNDELKLNLEFDVKLLSYKPFTASNSSVNVAVTFFWRGFNQPYHVKCYQTELQFFSYFGDGVKTGEKWFFTYRFGDEVAQFKIVDNLKVGAFKHYELDVMPHVKEMMTRFGLQEIQLKHVEIFVEAYKGYGAVEVYFAKISLEPTCVQNHFGFTLLLVIISLILIAIGMVIVFYKLFKRNKIQSQPQNQQRWTGRDLNPRLPPCEGGVHTS